MPIHIFRSSTMHQDLKHRATQAEETVNHLSLNELRKQHRQLRLSWMRGAEKHESGQATPVTVIHSMEQGPGFSGPIWLVGTVGPEKSLGGGRDNGGGLL